MFETISLQTNGDADYLNIFSMGDNWLIHRQIERRKGRLFMRAKRRTL